MEKSFNHDHFWVQDCILYESYKTIRGLRFRAISEVLYPDTEVLTDDQLESILNIKSN